MASRDLFWHFIRKIFLSSSRLFNRIQNVKDVRVNRRRLLIFVFVIFSCKSCFVIISILPPFFKVDGGDGGSFAGEGAVGLFLEGDEYVGLQLVDVVQVVADDSGERNLSDLLQLGRSECARMLAVFVPKSITC